MFNIQCNLYLFSFLIPLKCNLNQGRDFCPFLSVLNLQCHEQYLEHNWCSVHICWMSKWLFGNECHQQNNGFVYLNIILNKQRYHFTYFPNTIFSGIKKEMLLKESFWESKQCTATFHAFLMSSWSNFNTKMKQNVGHFKRNLVILIRIKLRETSISHEAHKMECHKWNFETLNFETIKL